VNDRATQRILIQTSGLAHGGLMEDVHRRQTSATEVRWRGGGRPARSAEHRARERFGAPLARSSSARAAHSGTVMRREIARNTVAMSGARARQPTALRSIYLAPVGRSRGGQATRPRCSRQAARAASHRSKPAHESREHRCSEDRPHSSEHSAAAVSPCPGVGRRRAPCGSVKTTGPAAMLTCRSAGFRAGFGDVRALRTHRTASHNAP
jgi:hypothetical protein